MTESSGNVVADTEAEEELTKAQLASFDLRTRRLPHADRIKRFKIKKPRRRSAAMKIGWPTDLTWYTLLYSWQTLIAGVFAILAAIIAYRVSLKQVKETQRQVEATQRQLEETRRAVLGRKIAYTAMAALEVQRIEEEAERQQGEIAKADKEHVNTRYTLTQVYTREFLRNEWEQLGSLGPDAAIAVYHLIDAIDTFNGKIGPRPEIYKGTAQEMLAEIGSRAKITAKLLTDELERTPEPPPGLMLSERAVGTRPAP